MRDATLRLAIALGTAAVLLTELLGAFHLLYRPALAAAWIVVFASLWFFRRRIFEPLPTLQRPSLLESVAILAIAGLAALIGLTALLSPPNSADAMAYHMPRVIYWVQNHSVAFFTTPYLNQIMLQPVAEYLMLHTYLLSGGDHFVNLVQFAGYVGSIVAVSAVAGAMGLDRRGQTIATIFCATLPNAILQASGAKNDALLSLWLAAMVYFALRGKLVFTSLALGLALGTKATAYLFAPPLLATAWAASGSWRRVNWTRAILALAAGVLLINLPQYLRNIDLSGSPLGFDSAQGDGRYRWRNDRLGPGATVSNAIRNLSEQLGSRSDAANQWVYRAALRLHVALGLDPQDPGTTWLDARFRPPKNANHEADANNRWHLAIVFLAFLGACYAAVRHRRFVWLFYGLGPLAAFILFCFYLKWQPFLARLELPLFVASAPLAAALLSKLRPQILAIVACVFLLSIARLPAIQNWTRPLSGSANVFVTPRDQRYFADIAQFGSSEPYWRDVAALLSSPCRRVGIDSNANQLEYPLQALLLERDLSFRFVHVNVKNASRKYSDPAEVAVCAIVRIP